MACGFVLYAKMLKILSAFLFKSIRYVGGKTEVMEPPVCKNCMCITHESTSQHAGHPGSVSTGSCARSLKQDYHSTNLEYGIYSHRVTICMCICFAEIIHHQMLCLYCGGHQNEHHIKGTPIQNDRTNSKKLPICICIYKVTNSRNHFICLYLFLIAWCYGLCRSFGHPQTCDIADARGAFFKRPLSLVQLATFTAILYHWNYNIAN